jgi:pilus assembly protein FimV
VGRSIANAVVAAALLLALPLAAHAAGLGKLTVLSPLGRPLNAEIEIVALQPGEEDGLTARLASPEAFRQAGIEFNGALLGVRFNVERRGSRSVLKLTTSQPVNEPFMELLVELQWSTGRLVREYTFLLDPSEYKGPAAIASVPAAPKPQAKAEEPKAEEAKAAEPKAEEPKAEQPKSEEQKAETAQAEEPKPAAPEVKQEEPKPQEAKPEAGQPSLEAKPLEPAPAAEAKAAEPKPAAGPAATYEVKKGDTLGKIAKQYMAPGITLDQMLIAIYRANQEAFIRDNVNLVRAGKILNIPSGEGAGLLDADDAKRLVRSHNADFNAYRSRLAATPAPAEATPGQRETAGTIEPKPAAVPPEKQDQLKLSRAEPQKPGAASSRAAQGDDLAARERALKESQSRVSDLEKNAADLQKLLELKNQQLAELEKRAAPKPPVVAEAPKPAPAPAPVPVPAPAAKAPEKPAAEAPKPVPVPAPAAKAPEKPAAEAPKPAAEAPKPAAEAPKPAAEAPKPAAEAPKPKPPAEAPKPAAKKVAPPEPSVIDEFLDNPTALGSLAAVVLLLVGYGAWAWRRKKRSQAKFQDSVLDAASGAGAASVFGTPSTGAAAGAAGVSQASVSQSPAGMEAEEVDPIAEADVYMAYGRDAQAEEILKEALAKDASRTPVLAKLLEIYANRKDTKSFEQSALKLKGLTNGAGPGWDKAAALGRSIDPQNGLYGGGGGSAASAAAAPSAAAAAAAAAPTLDFDLGGATTPGSTDISLDAPKEAGGSVDFDLGAATSASAASGQPSDFTPEGTLIMDQKAADSTGGLDFDLGMGDSSKTAAPPSSTPAADTSGGLDFDLNLDGGDKSATQSAPSMDLSAISLDLGETAAPAGGGNGDPKWQEVATKLDLAKAYEEMGDKDGARELLNEVMKDGDSAQKGQAQQLLAKLG